REDHDLPPDDRARAEGEVEVVLAIELDAEQGLQRGAVRGEIEEVRLAGGRAALELAPPEEREGDVDAARDVRVHTDVVAAVALAHVVGAEVEPEVQVRLDPAPEEGRRVEERRHLEVARALEIRLVAGREPEPQPQGGAPDVPGRQLVLAAQEDVPDV